MPYVEGQTVHDADSHIMEFADVLDPYFDPKLKDRFVEYTGPLRKKRLGEWVDEAKARHEDAEFRAAGEENLLLRKNHMAMGAFRNEDRVRALDLLGFASQLVFTTTCLSNFGLDERDDMDLAYAAAQAHNRMMVDFCSVDRRMLGTAYVPLADLERAPVIAREAIDMGLKGLVVPSRPPRAHSPSHVALDAVWAQAEEAGLPILFHVGGELKMDPAYIENGLPFVRDFHGGAENFTGLTFMAIPVSVQQTLAALIFDGVLDRFPNLKFGAIELGASWVPSFMRFLDAGFGAFRKGEERLQKLSALPSEIVKRQVRVTPYPHEDAGWIINQSGEEICLFSSDYPHVEGGRNPLKRFNDSLEGVSESAKRRFYRDNFIDLMGRGLAEDLRDLPVQAAA